MAKGNKKNTENQKKEKVSSSNIMRKIWTFIKWPFKHKIVSVFCLVVVFVLLVKFTPAGDVIKGKTQSENSETIIIQMESEMNAIGETATAENIISDFYKDTDYRKVLGFEIPMTKKEVAISYTVSVKAGYNIDNVTWMVDDTTKKVRVRLPEAEILDKTIVDREVLYEDVSCLNHLREDDAIKFDSEIIDDATEKAEEGGIFKEAENNMEDIIEDIVNRFGFEAEFI